MEQLRQKDLLAYSTFLQGLYSSSDLTDFVRRLLGTVSSLIPVDSAVYHEVDGKKNAWIVQPTETQIPEGQIIFARHMNDHPLVRHYQRHPRDTAGRKISDFISRLQLHSRGLYQEFFRHVEVEYQMVCNFSEAPHSQWLALVLNRTLKDFSERERLLLTLLQPHLWLAYRQAWLMTRLRQRPEVVDDEDVSGFLLAGSSRRRWNLNPQEIKVLTWILRAKTDTEIATILHISHRTVQKHLEHIYQKMGVENRLGAAMMAVQEAGWRALSHEDPPPQR